MGLLCDRLGSLAPTLPPALLPPRGSTQRGKAHVSTFTGSQPRSRRRSSHPAARSRPHCFLCCCSEAQPTTDVRTPICTARWQLLLVVGAVQEVGDTKWGS